MTADNKKKPLDKETINKLITLSRIDCSPEESESLGKDLQAILSYIDLLDEIDTTDTLPCNHVIEGICNVFREDTPVEPLSRDLFLKNSPAHVGGMIRVPPVIHGHES